MRRLLTFIVVTFLMCTLNVSASADKMKVIIDMDAEAADFSAVLYLLNRPEVDVLGITISATGLGHCNPGVQNVYTLIDMAGKNPQDFKVACGDEEPLDGYHVFPSEWRKNADNFLGYKRIDTGSLPTNLHAVDVIINLLEESITPITILAVGPLTNIAQLIEKDSSVKSKIDKIYIMGGAISASGNLIVPKVTDHLKNRVAEWNIYIDPVAAKIVFNSEIPIYLFPLDATNKVKATQSKVKKFNKKAQTKEAKFIMKDFSKNSFLIKIGEYYMWDILAASGVIDNDLYKYKTMNLDVVVKYSDKKPKSSWPNFSEKRKNGEPRRVFDAYKSGQTKKTKEGAPINVCTKVNVDGFWDRIIQVLNKKYYP